MDIITELQRIVEKAGELIMTVYQDPHFEVLQKSDNSPLTQADTLSNTYIVEHLKKISPHPIVAEESEFRATESLPIFWAVDPLDGTKDFIAHNDEFTINIALVESGKPVVGVMYVPAQKIFYSAERSRGAYRNGEKIFNNNTRTNLVGTSSRFHSGEAEVEFFKKYNITEFVSVGSALKLCKLAEGVVDVYPRFNGSKIWDIAPGALIAEEAGCQVIDLVTKKQIEFDAHKIANNHFIASRKDLDFKL